MSFIKLLTQKTYLWIFWSSFLRLACLVLGFSCSSVWCNGGFDRWSSGCFCRRSYSLSRLWGILRKKWISVKEINIVKIVPLNTVQWAKLVIELKADHMKESLRMDALDAETRTNPWLKKELAQAFQREQASRIKWMNWVNWEFLNGTFA